MRFVYGKQDMSGLDWAQEVCWLVPNGLGGYAAGSAAFSVTRCDQGILISAKTAPSERITLVHRLSEYIEQGGQKLELSSQEFADGKISERGFRNLSSFVWENGPVWRYEIDGLRVTRRCVMAHEENITAVLYQVTNHSREAASEVRSQLEALEPMLREGCVGQLPEIYDGLNPGTSRGCFAQAWSVGEMLTVFEELEKIERN